MFGTFVYDDEQGPNAGESVQLDVESRWYIINQLAQNYNQGRWRVIDSYGPPPPGNVPPPDLPGHGWSQAASATSSQNYVPPPEAARIPWNEPPTPGSDLQPRGELPQSSGASDRSRA